MNPSSSIVGTRPLGLSARYSAVLLPPKAPPTSERSNASPISPQHQRTFCTLLDVVLPRIFNIGFPFRARAWPRRSVALFLHRAGQPRDVVLHEERIQDRYRDRPEQRSR